jgi:hypothetical protein
MWRVTTGPHEYEQDMQCTYKCNIEARSRNLYYMEKQ